MLYIYIYIYIYKLNININYKYKYKYIKSLYNISHPESIEALRKFLQKSKLYISISIIITFLGLILILNHFFFISVNYLQKNGYPKGTECAPSYAKDILSIL